MKCVPVHHGIPAVLGMNRGYVGTVRMGLYRCQLILFSKQMYSVDQDKERHIGSTFLIIRYLIIFDKLSQSNFPTFQCGGYTFTQRTVSILFLFILYLFIQ